MPSRKHYNFRSLSAGRTFYDQDAYLRLRIAYNSVIVRSGALLNLPPGWRSGMPILLDFISRHAQTRPQVRVVRFRKHLRRSKTRGASVRNGGT